MTFNPDALSAFLQAVMAPGDCLEMRIFEADYANKGGYIVRGDRYSRVFAGWYNSPDSLICDARRLQGVSGFLIPNPTIPDMLACSDNKLTVIKKATKDEHIRCLRYMYLDFDAKKPMEDMSASDAERAVALGKRDDVLAKYPAIAESALWGSSGNGAWLLVRLGDLPNTEENRAMVARAVDYFVEHHGADPKTKNPARLMPLVGSLKCKGSSTADRPWRPVTLDGISNPSAPFDLAAFVTEHASKPPNEPTPQAKGKPSSVPAVASPVSYADLSEDAERIYRAAAYVDKIAPAISGQGGHDATFDAACALVIEFGLSTEQAMPILETWNQRCVPPWSPSELRHKLTDADAKGGPRGRLFDTKKETLPAVVGANAVAAVGLAGDLGQPGDLEADSKGDRLVREGQEDNPHQLSSWFLRTEHNHVEGYSLRFWQDEFHTWKGGAYHPVSGKELKARLAKWLASELHRVYVNQLMASGLSETSKKPQLIPVTTTLTGNVKQALSGECLVDNTDHPNQPCWLDDHQGWPVTEIIPTRNAVVHVPSYLAGKSCTRPPTPLLFSPYTLNYDWQPDAPKPERWLKFLAETWPDDPQSIETLQEWFGLQVVPVTSYEKMLAMIGPPRAGKGVIASVMRAMIGPENCCGPTLSGLAETFGMQNLVGKLAAIIDDARLSGKSDQATITERLLSISGQGCLDVRRMYRPQWTGVLTCRVTLISNELPRLNDNANALANRFIVLKFTKSHLGSEDNSLKAALLSELPGILLWSLEGLRRLAERGHLVQPASGLEIHEEMEEMSSPIGSFVKDCLDVDDPDGTATKEDLYRSWKQWCEANGRREAGELSVFCRNLRSVVPGLKAIQKRDGARRLRIFQGVSLLSPAEMFGPSPEAEGMGGYTDENGVPF